MGRMDEAPKVAPSPGPFKRRDPGRYVYFWAMDLPDPPDPAALTPLTPLTRLTPHAALPEPEHLLFTYGTLMLTTGIPEVDAVLQDAGTSLGRGWIRGRLFDLGEYPGAIAADAGAEAADAGTGGADPAS